MSCDYCDVLVRRDRRCYSRVEALVCYVASSKAMLEQHGFLFRPPQGSSVLASAVHILKLERYRED